MASSRSQQAKKDAQIRKKIRHDLQQSGYEPIVNADDDGNDRSDRVGRVDSDGTGVILDSKSTVMDLNPSQPVNCSPDTTVFEAARLMALTKENCVLAVDDKELAGIFTAKDLAFRVVGSKFDSKKMMVDRIMTTNPLCAKDTTPASDALNLMVVKRFRHLPIVDGSSAVAGLLDITKCYDKAMDRLEEMYQSSQNLYDAMDSVNTQMGAASKRQSIYIVRYFDNMKKLLTGPSLQEVINSSKKSAAVYCEVTATVYDAAVLMKSHNVTAVLVRDRSSKVVGIFTSKDIVLRVIATDKDPNTCQVIEVMTPNPSCATSDMSLSSAMRMMSEGHYLNLPVTDTKTGKIVGVVDVITLTRRSLIQIQTMESINEDNDDNNKNTDQLWDHPTTQVGSMSRSELNQFDVAGGRSLSYQHTCQFKLKLSNGSTYRLQYKPAVHGYKGLERSVEKRLSKDDLAAVYDKKSHYVGLSYLDEDSDEIEIRSDQDLRDCIDLQDRLGNSRVVLYVQKPGASAMRTGSFASSSNREVVVGLACALAVVTAVAFSLYRSR